MADQVYLKTHSGYLRWSTAEKQYVTASRERATPFDRGEAEAIVAEGFLVVKIEEI